MILHLNLFAIPPYQISVRHSGYTVILHEPASAVENGREDDRMTTGSAICCTRLV